VSAKKRAPAKPSWFVDDHAAIRKMLAAAFLSDGLRRALRPKTAKKLLRQPNKSNPA
jgi:hypothetical protein